MNFHDVRFPTGLSFGSTGGLERRTEIVSLANGHEERNSPWAHSRRRYDAGIGMRSLDDLETVVAFFEARRGQLYGFRWRDWGDYKSCRVSDQPAPTDQVIGVGDGVTTVYQLTKTYRSGETVYVRPIIKPAEGTVGVALSADEKRAGEDFLVDHASGLVTFAAPPPIGDEISAGFEFDVPVRFDTDRIEINLAAFRAGQIPSIPVLEVRA